MKPAVYVVFCMDTEGPMNDPANSALLGSWEKIDPAMDKLFAPSFRSLAPDSKGGHLKVGWFFLTHTGFQTNPRGRDFGYHKVRDHFIARWGKQIDEYGDEHCWHYHHPNESGVANEWGLDWTKCREFDNILSRQILERRFFPSCYRAGGTIMDALSNRWVDTWFPFDYSNRAPLVLPGLVDWSRGVKEWSVYHPSVEDFCSPGAGRRRMARCLDLVTGVYTMKDEEIVAAFKRAQAGKPAILSCFDHDYRDIADRVRNFMERLSAIAKKYPDVPWHYASPVEAVRGYEQMPAQPRLDIELSLHGRELRIWSSEPLYQSIPWVAVKTNDGQVRHIEAGVGRVDVTHWRWDIPADLNWTEIGVGGSTDYGQSATTLLSDKKLFQNHPHHPNSIWEYTQRYALSCEERSSGKAPEMDSVKQAVALLKDKIKPGASVLDVGCGAGHAWLSVKKLGIAYHGIDSYARGIEIGRKNLSSVGLPEAHLRALALEDLPASERYDAVLCLSSLFYFPMFHQPLQIMARAAKEWLIIRSSFGEQTQIRYLPDVLLEPGFQATRAYFNIFSRAEVSRFLEKEGFEVTWQADERQSRSFNGEPEVVGGIALPYEFLVAKRVRSTPTEKEILSVLEGKTLEPV